MISLAAFHRVDGAKHTIEFDSQNSTVDVLHLQLFSLVDVEVVMVDYAGRVISSVADLLSVSTPLIDTSDITGSAITAGTCDLQAAIWMCEKSLSIRNICSSQLFSSEETIIQPLYSVTDTTFALCMGCVNQFDASMITPCAGKMAPFTCGCKEACDFGFSRTPYIKPESIDLANPLKLYFKRLYFNENVSFQRGGQSGQEQQFKSRLMSGCETVKRYEEVEHQQAAREVIDMDRIQRYADEFCKKSIAESATGVMPAEDICFMKGLLRWFKCDFFKWTNGPPCDNCTRLGAAAPKKKGMQCIGMAEPTGYERNVCWAQRVELHKCKACDTVTRFPRVNNPSVLVTTSRRGRCGEWANAFCLICRTIGIDALYTMDWTDHVWVEVWIPSLGRYVHADSCERALDSPLVYETGWNKKLLYVVSFSRHSVVDTTTRYTRKYDEVLLRRAELSESFISGQVNHFDKLVNDSYVARLSRTASLHGTSNKWGANVEVGNGSLDVSLEQLATRRALHCRELLGYMFSKEQNWKPEENVGRISGDESWKQLRGEDGSGGGEDKKPSPEECELSIAAKAKCGAVSHLKLTGNENTFSAGDSLQESRYCRSWLRNGYAPFGTVSGSRAEVVVLPTEVCLPNNTVRPLPLPDEAQSSIRNGAMELYTSHPDIDCKIAYCGIPIVIEGSMNRHSGIVFDISNSGAIIRAESRSQQGNESFEFDPGAATVAGTADAIAGSMVAVTTSVCARGIENFPATSLNMLDMCRYSVHNFDASLASPVAEYEIIYDFLCTFPSEAVNLSSPDISKSELNHLILKYLAIPDVQGCSVCPKRNLFLVFRYTPGSGDILQGCRGAVSYVKKIAYDCLSKGHGTNAVSDRPDATASEGSSSNADDGVVVDAGSVVCSSVDHSLPMAASAVLSPVPVRCEHVAASTWLYFAQSSRVSYPDTQQFDTTQGVGSFLDAIVGQTVGSNGVQLDEIIVHAGAYVNGLSCVYKIERGVSCDSGDGLKTESPRAAADAPAFSFSSADLFGQNDSPQRTLVKINSDPITAITVKSGGWVDSIQFQRKSGVIQKFGGSGGSYSHSIVIPDGYSLIGFYGGIGGHLHNVGVVLKSDAGRSAAGFRKIDGIPRASCLTNKLLSLVSQKGLWNCKMLSYDQLVSGFRQPDIGSLLQVVSHVFENNNAETASMTLRANVAYLLNIIKKPLNKSIRKIKLSNSYFQKNILVSSGGLSLFCFGPGAFKFAYDRTENQCMLQCYEPLLEEEGGCVIVTDWVQALQDYCSFLRALLDVCA